MYVERINSNGTIHVSQFNWLVNGQWGRYSEMDIASSGLVYIYF
jgi:surface antigen